MNNDDIVTLESRDGDKREIAYGVVKLSSTVANLVEDAGVDNPIPIPNVTTKTLDKIIEYLIYHEEHPREHLDYEGKGLDDIGEWDLQYCASMNNAVLFDVIVASNYLDIQSLLHLTCKTVAKMIKGKKPDEIKKVLAIEAE